MLNVTFLLIVEGEDDDGKEAGSTFSFSSQDLNFFSLPSLSFEVMLISYPTLISEKDWMIDENLVNLNGFQ